MQILKIFKHIAEKKQIEEEFKKLQTLLIK